MSGHPKSKKPIILLVFALVAAIWWFWPSEVEKSDKLHPTQVDTRHLSDRDLVPLSVNSPSLPTLGAAPPIQPIQAREKWMASLSVLVIDAKNAAPIGNVKIELSGPIKLPNAWTDTDGNARYLLLPGGTYIYKLKHDIYALKGRKGASIVELKQGEHRELLIEMHRSCLASGRLISARNAEPISGGQIYPNRYEENEPVLSDQNGRFELSTGEFDQANIYFNADGYSPKEIMLGCRNNSIDLGDIVLSGAWTLHGRVTDIENEGIPGVTIQDYPRQPGTTAPGNQIEATSDKAGNFRLTGLPTTNEWIYFYKEGYAPTSAGVSSATGEDFSVTMHPICSMSGVVVDMDGEGIEGATVSVRGDGGLSSSSFSGRNMDITVKDGSFTIFNIRPGEHEILVSRFTPSGNEVRFARGFCGEDEAPLTIEMKSGHEYYAEGAVIDENGNPIAEAIIAVIPQKRQKRKMNSFRYSTTDESGKFSAAVPNEGAYNLYAANWKTGAKGKLKDLEGQQSGLKIIVEVADNMPDVATSGIVKLADGSIVQKYEYCWGLCGSRSEADEQGRWTRNGSGLNLDYPPLWIFLEDGRIGRSMIFGETSVGAEAEVIISSGASLSGSLGDSFPSGLTQLELIAHGTIAELHIDTEFHFPLIPPGLYNIRLTASNGMRLDKEGIIVNDGKPKDLGVIELTSEE